MAETTPPVPDPKANMGEPLRRYGARGKVTGAPIYADDLPLPDAAFALFVTSGIAKGRIASIDTAAAEALPGVVKLYTWHNAPKREVLKHMQNGGYVSDTAMPLVGPEIVNDGQIIAVVVADDLATARDAAHRIAVRYVAETPSATFDSPGTGRAHPDRLARSEKKTGDFEAGFAGAAVTVDARYSTPTMHHNPMELFSTAVAFDDAGKLVIHEPSQFVWQLKNGAAAGLGIEPERVEVRDPFVGGAFGSKGMMTQRTPLIAAIARDLERPIRNVVMRDQGFTLATYRAETRHRVRLGVKADGHLTALSHEGWEVTSRQDDYSVAGTHTTTEMYACPNVTSHVELVKADRNTPGFMRSPPETPYMYALESAMDELAVALGMDPVELRRINDTKVSPISGLPYTSRSLMECYAAAAKSFGWSRRNPRVRSMSEGDWLIGYGCATASYPTLAMPSAARVVLTSEGRAHVLIAAHDVGTGAYTVMQQVAAHELGLDPALVEVSMGDTALPPGPVAGGSMTTASGGSAVKAACDKLRARFGGSMPGRDDLRAAFARLGTDRIEEYGEWAPPGSGENAVKALYTGRLSGSGEGGGDKPKPPMYAFGAEFVEVRVHRLTREIRVARMTGAFAAGRIVNPRTARSQYLGGMIWGLGQALLEQTEIDRLRARYVNDNLAEYLVAVNADVPEVDIIFVPEVDDQVNPLGVKGIGELANVGTAAAIANAVYHATGKRIRDLPLTIDKLLV